MLDYFSATCRDRIETIPSLNNLAREIYERDSFDIKGLEKSLEKMIENDFVISFLDYELQKLIRDHDYIPPQSSFSSITLIDCKTVKLNLRSLLDVSYSDKTNSNAYSSDMVIASLSKKGIGLELFEQENPIPLDILDTSKKIKFREKISLNYSESIFLERHKDIVKFSDDKGNDSFFFLMLTSKDESPFVWEYNNEGVPTRLVSGNLKSTRVEHTCDLLGKIGHNDSIPVLEKFIKHDNFNIRWEAAKSIMNISNKKGIEIVQTMTNDDHPQIRKAATNSLKRILK